MTDIAYRFPENPILTPEDLSPSQEGLIILCLFNPGVFSFEGKIWVLARVAESTAQKPGILSFPFLNNKGKIEIVEVLLNDPTLIANDPRKISYKGVGYLTTISHLRLLCSNNGIDFYEPEGYDLLKGQGAQENFGIEDCRVTKIEDTFYLTYTAVSDKGIGVGLRLTKDWKNFEHKGMIFPPQNKDCAIFQEKINNKFYALHRPSGIEIGGEYIWLAESLDGLHWGNHQCIVKTRTGFWDSERVGAGAAPIKTPYGWLEIYHGADAEHHYALGAFLMDLDNPAKILSRTVHPIMIPSENYELNGFLGHVVFTNGHIVNGDEVTLYYGAADQSICGAKFSVKEILSLLR